MPTTAAPSSPDSGGLHAAADAGVPLEQYDERKVHAHNTATYCLISRGVHPHSRETLETYARGFGADGGRDAARRGAAPPTSRRWPRRSTTTPRAVFLQQPNFLGTVEDLGAARRGRQATGALVVCAGRPADARHPRAARRASASTSAWARGSRSATGSTSAGPSFGFFAAREQLHPQDAGPDRRRDGGRRRQARLRAHAPDARAAHPPREGDAQHLHLAGAERARGRRSTCPGSAEARHRRARRADAAPHRTTRARRSGSSRSTRARSCASSPCACRTSTALFERARARRASTPATGSAHDYPEYEDGLLVAITERRTRAADRRAGRRAGCATGGGEHDR